MGTQLSLRATNQFSIVAKKNKKQFIFVFEREYNINSNGVANIRQFSPSKILRCFSLLLASLPPQ